MDTQQRVKTLRIKTPAAAVITAARYDREAIAKRVKAHEEALEFPIQQVTRAIRCQTRDWAEAFEIALQRIERQALEAQQRADKVAKVEISKGFVIDQVANAKSAREAVQEYARFAEVYAEVFKQIEPVLRDARQRVATQLLIEYPNRADVQGVAEHLHDNTPDKWLDEWDPNEV